jgi:SAM-dependent methyltransferase
VTSGLTSLNARGAALVQAALEIARSRHRSPLAKDVARLSSLFTRDRAGRAASYLTEPALRRAYLGFYAPRNALRIALLLRALEEEGWVLPLQRPRVLDLGAGPCAGVLGAWVAYGALGLARAVDLAAPALADGRALLEALSADLEALDTRVGNVTTPRAWGPSDPADLVIVANVLGELGDPRRDLSRRTAVVQAALERLAPAGRLLVVEPGTRIHSRGLMAVRDELVAAGTGFVLAPCTGARRCPLLQTRSDWCHDELPYTEPEAARRVAQEAGLSPGPLKHSYLLLAREPVTLARGAVRLVSGVLQGASGPRRFGCAAEGLLVLEGERGPLPRERRGARLAAAPAGCRLQAPESSRAGPSSKSPRKRRGSGAD